MKLTDFDFQLPDRLIAQTPAERRDQSRLLVFNRQDGSIVHDRFYNLADHLPHRPLMLMNDTRVIPARLRGHREDTGKPVEALLIAQTEPGIHEALIKGLGKLPLQVQLRFGDGRLTARLLEKRNGRARLALCHEGPLTALLEEIAEMPLPPYIRREASTSHRREDHERYQTIYAGSPGAIAAPTAGLHFTRDLLETIRSKGIETAFLTLDVGVGTFLPIREENVLNHKMEVENYRIPEATWGRVLHARSEGRKVLAVGTTTARVLESVDFTAPAKGDVTGATGLFLYPGRSFKTVDHLLTNFHLPKSSLYLLVCAFAGKERMAQCYEEAIRQDYRFYSYGDAMLIL